MLPAPVLQMSFRVLLTRLVKGPWSAAGAALLLGCGGESAGLAVGDAMARAPGPSVLDVARPLLRAGVPAVHIVQKGARVTAADEWAGEVQMAEQLAADPQVIAIIGHNGSRNTALGLTHYRAAGIPVLAPTATSEALRQQGAAVFLLAPENAVQGAFLATVLRDSLRARRPVLLHVADLYGIGIRNGMRAALAAGGPALAAEGIITGDECGAIDRRAMAAQVEALIARGRPDAMVVAAGSVQARCAVRAVRRLAPALPVVLSDAFTGAPDEMVGLSADDLRRVAHVWLWDPAGDSASRAFDADFRAIVGRPPTWADAMTMDAMRLVRTAVDDGVRTRDELTAWLESLGRSRPAVAGLTGPLAFDRPRTAALHLRWLDRR